MVRKGENFGVGEGIFVFVTKAEEIV